jgi:hypothetical protein
MPHILILFLSNIAKGKKIGSGYRRQGGQGFILGSVRRFLEGVRLLLRIYYMLEFGKIRRMAPELAWVQLILNCQLKTSPVRVHNNSRTPHRQNHIRLAGKTPRRPELLKTRKVDTKYSYALIIPIYQHSYNH